MEQATKKLILNIHHQQVQESLVLHLKELFQLWIEDIEKQNHRE